MELERKGNLSEGKGASPIKQNRSGNEEGVVSPD